MFDFISDQVLEFCQEYGLILLIHIPRAKRLRDRRNIEELKEMGRRYPNIKIVLAHAGRSYCYSDIKDSIMII
ncbi:MAG: amidohydrolase family protein [Actinomycetota bacterium]|nr:amidohydrolase family protein [Actinomycetota bacterium]